MPALVHALTAPRSVHAWSVTAPRMVPAETLLQEQTAASSGSSSSGAPPPPSGSRNAAGSPGQLAAEHRAQARVRAGVADEDAAEQGAGVVGHDELLVDAAHRVGPDDLEGVLGVSAERVAEAGDVDAGELELGRGVRAGERRRCRRAAGPRRPRPSCSPGATSPMQRPSMQATSPTAEMSRSWSADSVDDDAAALADRQARPRGPARRAGRTPAATTTTSTSTRPPSAKSSRPTPPSPVRPHLGGRASRRGRRCLAVDEALQRLAAAEVHLHAHQVRAELDDGGLRAPSACERARRLQAEQAAADDGAAHRLDHAGSLGALLDPAAQRRDVVDGAVDEHARQVVARDRRHPGAGAGREHQLVVVRATWPSAVVTVLASRSIDVDLAVGVQGDQRVGPQRRVAQGEVLGVAPEN